MITFAQRAQLIATARGWTVEIAQDGCAWFYCNGNDIAQVEPDDRPALDNLEPSVSLAKALAEVHELTRDGYLDSWTDALWLAARRYRLNDALAEELRQMYHAS